MPDWRTVAAVVLLCIIVLGAACMAPEEPDAPDAPGFIILRNVCSERTDRYWKLCYESIRRVYRDAPVLIIDDNSDAACMSPHATTNTTVVQSEYPGRGELLPYVYYLKYRIADRVVILHDSVFLTRRVPFDRSRPYQHLWSFEPSHRESGAARLLAACLTGDKLVDLYNGSRWKGCFGGMSVVSHAFLSRVDAACGISSLLGLVKSRPDRMAFERALACMFLSCASSSPPPVYGDIHAYCPWGLQLEDAAAHAHLPAIKVWTSR